MYKNKYRKTTFYRKGSVLMEEKKTGEEQSMITAKNDRQRPSLRRRKR